MRVGVTCARTPSLPALTLSFLSQLENPCCLLTGVPHGAHPLPADEGPPLPPRFVGLVMGSCSSCSRGTASLLSFETLALCAGHACAPLLPPTLPGLLAAPGTLVPLMLTCFSVTSSRHGRWSPDTCAFQLEMERERGDSSAEQRFVNCEDTEPSLDGEARGTEKERACLPSPRLTADSC